MAIDEIREIFDVTPMKKHPEAENQQVIQKWFPGEHGCVGGGTKEHSGLSDAALQWMIDSVGVLGLGLDLDPSVIPTGINPNYECDFKNDVGFFKLAGIKFREVGDVIEDIHESTINRLKSRKDYRPKNLQKIPESELQRAKALGSEDNYYREDIIQALAKPDAEYYWDFQIQFQTSPEMSIDDTTILWNEKESPFFTVGRLTVKHQKVNSPKENDFGENLSFSPGNGLAVHRPVGAINRLRSIVYPIVADDRHKKRGVKYQEPTV